MLQTEQPRPVKVIAVIFYVKTDVLPTLESKLQQSFGTIDFVSSDFPFTVTDYYNEEMGSPIKRRIYSFEPLIDPGILAELKIRSNTIEREMSRKGKRQVNIDIGYLDYDKVVLASTKYNWQKIYLQSGIYADLTLRYEKGTYYPFPWSFPDFKTPDYYPAFLKIRGIYKQQMKQIIKDNQ